MNKKQTIVNNLQEFLDSRGCGDSPYGWARAFYKYTDCGPWSVFIMKDREIYYEDKAVATVTNDNCIGIKIGSIVEGSEAYSGPFEYMFPFDSEEFDRDVQLMEDETSFYWERDNSQWYQVLVGEKAYFCHNTWGDIIWDGPPPSTKLRKKIEAFINEHFDDIPHEESCWGKPNPGWKPASIPRSRAVIWETYNDTTF